MGLRTLCLKLNVHLIEIRRGSGYVRHAEEMGVMVTFNLITEPSIQLRRAPAALRYLQGRL